MDDEVVVCISKTMKIQGDQISGKMACAEEIDGGDDILAIAVVTSSGIVVAMCAKSKQTPSAEPPLPASQREQEQFNVYNRQAKQEKKEIEGGVC